MALVKCRHCGNMISDKAKKCPKCNQVNDNNAEVPKVTPSFLKADENCNKVVQAANKLHKESQSNNIKDVASMDLQSKVDENEVECKLLDGSKQNATSSKSRTGLIITIIILLIILIIGGIFVFFNYSQSGKSLIEKCEEIPVSSQDKKEDDILSIGNNDESSSSAELQRIVNVSVISSSTLEKQGSNSYYASNLLDGSLETAWATTYTGNKEKLIFSTPSCIIHKILINNGYGKSEITYKNNSRAKIIEIYINGTFVQSAMLEDTWRTQTIVLNKAYTAVHEIEILISDVYDGLKYRDLCISDISFWGSNSDMISRSSKNVVFKGNIDDKYSIAMNLQIEGSSVKGKYYYTKYDSSNFLRLAGTYSDGTFNLKEYNSDDKYTGAFNGRYEDNIFSGVFVNYKGEQMPFKFYSVN